MKKWFIIAIFASLTLTACGVKGSLYYPEKEVQQETN
ncbi:Predicted small periplasmic lipoprotein [Phocoenobacter uteri]|uniref:Predicted small periplasmic lipoprotein n=1 Tax=Phocoenobacter uteri TaxID=146806 RepID=A0A379CAI8_9PAST|nr:lipoprotein [Phocoenobacter uteri]SUB59392.1 Predicted small periplasmic lipoprotein [Phocoenobacter uteri]